MQPLVVGLTLKLAKKKKKQNDQKCFVSECGQKWIFILKKKKKKKSRDQNFKTTFPKEFRNKKFDRNKFCDIAQKCPKWKNCSGYPKHLTA